MDHNDSDVLPLQHPLLHNQRRERQDIAIPTNGSKVLQELVGDRDTRWLAFAIDPHEQDARRAVIRQVVSKGADSLAELIAVGG
jgi:hypothetical protein